MLMLRRGFSTSFPRCLNYGFIGLGRMGLNMAQNLQSKSDPSDKIIVYDVVRGAADKLVGSNIVMANSVTEVAEHADVVITMLPEGKHVRTAYGELADNLAPSTPKTFIDSSTIDLKTTLETAKLLERSNIGTFVDAPVSGGTIGAKNGTLTFMVGSKDLSSLKPVLEKMGSRIVSCGGLGSGISAKLANNYLLALSNIATSEAFQLAKNLGLDLKVFSGIVNTSSGQCWSSQINNPVPGINENAPSSRDYENGFGVSLMYKDLKLANEAAKQAKLNLPMADRAAEIYDEVNRIPELKNKDMSVIYKWLEQH